MAEPRKLSNDVESTGQPPSPARADRTADKKPTGKTMQELERLQFDVLDRTGGFDR